MNVFAARSDIQPDAALRAAEAAHHAPTGTFVTLADTAAIERMVAAAHDRAPRHPLAGQPCVVKDNIHVSGLPTTAGTPAFQGWLPENDAAVVAKLKACGMIVIGKTNLHELALGVTSSHSASGAVVNPVLPGRVAGGSSGGTAAAIAAGVCGYGLGSDTGGSARIPAAFTDIWGYRPSTGRYSERGLVSIAYSRDTAGPMAAKLALLRRIDTELALRTRAKFASPTTWRVGICPADVAACDTNVGHAVQQFVAQLRRLPGLQLIELDFEPLDRLAASVEPLLGAQELAPCLARSLRADPALPTLDGLAQQIIDPHVSALLAGSRAAVADGVWSETYQAILTECARLRGDYLALLRSHRLDLVLRPAVPVFPPLMDEVLGLDLAGRERLFQTITRFTRLATILGSPSLTLPLGRVFPPKGQYSGIGMLLDGLPGCDEELLYAAAALTAALAQQ